MKDTSSVFALRLKTARLAKGLTQEGLGIKAGIDEFSAKARINQYEHGVHSPHYSTVEKIAEVLQLPAAYFYCKKDNEAELLSLFHQLDNVKQDAVVKLLRTSLDL